MSTVQRSTVWMPSVPLPWQGLLYVRCATCGRRFRRGRQGDLRSYDTHWLARHTTWPDGSIDGYDGPMAVVPVDRAAALMQVVVALRGKPNAARVLGPLIVTTCMQGTGAALLDDCFVGDVEGRRYHGKALHLRPWRRDRYGERLRARALVVGWRE